MIVMDFQSRWLEAYGFGRYIMSSFVSQIFIYENHYFSDLCPISNFTTASHIILYPLLLMYCFSLFEKETVYHQSKWDILLEIQGNKTLVKVSMGKATLLLRSNWILGTSQVSTEMFQSPIHFGTNRALLIEKNK